MRKIFVAAAIIVAISGCKGANEREVQKMVLSDVLLAPPPVDQVKFPPPVVVADEIAVVDDYGDRASKTGKPNSIEKKVIKEGEVRFKTGNITSTRKALYASLKKLGGYVAVENENNDSENGRKEITLQARIPAKNFDAFLNDVSANAESIESKSIRIKDVTTQFIDISTKLANKKKLEERYLELLQKGSKIADLLEIESKLTEIRSDIESAQGQLNYLTKQVEYSSLNITFYSRQTVKDNGQSFGYKIRTALFEGWLILGNLFFGFIAWWPIWLVIFGFVYALRKWRKKRFEKTS